MGIQVNNKAFIELILEDIAWLLTCPRTLERDHTVAVLKRVSDLVWDESPEASKDPMKIS